MTHGDDDGLRLPPAIAPRQIVIVPILRDKPEDAEVLAYGEALAKALTATTTLGERIRALRGHARHALGRQALGVGAPGRADHRRGRTA